MDAPAGLRERKKQRIRLHLSETAMNLFQQRGFDAVTVTEVAAAADVSPTTVFNYFPTKEDLFFDRADEVIGHLARVVRDRSPGQSPLAACRDDFLHAIKRQDWTCGLGPRIARFYACVDASPALQARVRLLAEESAIALVEVIETERGTVHDPVAIVMAQTLVAVRTTLLGEARRLILAGVALPQASRRLTAFTRRAYQVVAEGLDHSATGRE